MGLDQDQQKPAALHCLLPLARWHPLFRGGTQPLQIVTVSCYILHYLLLQILAHTSWMIEKVLKLGLQTFSIFIMAQTKCAQHQLSRRWNIYHQKYIFGSNFHSKPSAGMALDILAPSYVNVKVMDVWRVLRMNRWLLDGQHFITWRRDTGSWGAAICYKWRWKHANKAGTMPPNGQHLYSDSTLTFFLLDRSPCIISGCA